MFTRIPQDPDDIVTELIEPLSNTFSGLIHGSLQAREHFEKYEMDINRPLAADITRFHARQFLQVNAQPQPEYLLHNVGNNGIRIRAGVATIKVVKGRDNDPPCPNHTFKDKRFYSQPVPYQPVLIEDIFKPFESHEWAAFANASDKLNLILCWEADAAHRITQLSLMCPRKIWAYRQSAEVFWRRSVPSPHFASNAIPDLNKAYEDIDDLEVFFDDSEDLTGTDDDN